MRGEGGEVGEETGLIADVALGVEAYSSIRSRNGGGRTEERIGEVFPTLILRERRKASFVKGDLGVEWVGEGDQEACAKEEDEGFHDSVEGEHSVRAAFFPRIEK